MTGEVALRETGTAGLSAKVEYAKVLADSGLLPRAYQRNPSNVLYAIEYGSMLGLAPMAAITGVHVIEGKPSASAGLISALVRRAGHKLRVTGDAKSATCQIIRCDDPDYTFEVTWEMRKNAKDNPNAEDAGLLNKNIWKQYGASMLKSRAITQCARDACEEALFGLHYTAEELGAEVNAEGDPLVSAAPAVQASAADPWAAAPAPDAATDPEWLAGALKCAGEVTEDTYKALWSEAGEKVREGVCTAADADQIREVIRVRMDSLRTDSEPVDAEIVPDIDPSDPWAAKAEEITTAGEGQQALDEVADLVAQGKLDVDYGRAVAALIGTRIATLAERVAA